MKAYQRKQLAPMGAGWIEKAARYMFENREQELDQSPIEDDDWDTLPDEWRWGWIEGATRAAEAFGLIDLDAPGLPARRSEVKP